MHISKPQTITKTSLLAIALTLSAAPALAQSDEPKTAWEASRETRSEEMITTGVARGRDRLSSATSTSSIQDNDIIHLAPRSLAELLRNVPGIRVEAGSGEANNNYTVRGLPMANGAAKYIQFQEDGLPVLEFGDLMRLTPDIFLRADFNVTRVESIRGGSASTFASNAPGGVINMISKTGEVEGGSVMVTAGADHELLRTDFDYGGRLGNGWRFHVGGFFRDGEGPRETGINSYRGGQVKLNLTKQFDGGYIRFYGKYLDDRVPTFTGTPLLVTGTNENPVFADPVGIDSRSGSLHSPLLPVSRRLGTSGTPTSNNLADGLQVLARTVGFETQFSIGDWTITERFRFADQAADNTTKVFSSAASANSLATRFGGAGARFSYAAGPQAGQLFNPAAGNGLAGLSFFSLMDAPDISSMVNDLRISRVWGLGGGDLTTTAGLYRSNQSYVTESGFATFFQDAVDGGQSAPLNLTNAAGVLLTEGGVRNYGSPGSVGNSRNHDMTYQITAPFASINYSIGKIALGGSIRWDNLRARGRISNDGPPGSFDMNGNGVISRPETLVSRVRSDVVFPVNYHHDYVSYSLSVNYRISDSFATFARYSRGGRAGAEKILFTPAVSTVTGELVNPDAGHDTVTQAELGLKYRQGGLVINLTGFQAKTTETNTQISTNPQTGLPQLLTVAREYDAYGVEFEGGLRRGALTVMAHATYTKAEITGAENAALVGRTPRNQPDLIYGVTPQLDFDRFTVGASIIGVTDSFTQDQNLLRMPGFVTVDSFFLVRPIDRLELAVNANNLFNKLALTGISESTLPASGVVNARPMFGRTVSVSARFFF